jgi:hypothetical protein
MHSHPSPAYQIFRVFSAKTTRKERAIDLSVTKKKPPQPENSRLKHRQVLPSWLDLSEKAEYLASSCKGK